MQLKIGGMVHWMLEIKSVDEVDSLIRKLEDIKKQNLWPYLWGDQRQIVEVSRG